MATKILEDQKIPQLPDRSLIGSQKPETTADLYGQNFVLTLENEEKFCLSIQGDYGEFSTEYGAWPTNGRGKIKVCKISNGGYIISLDLEAPAIDAFTVVLLPQSGRAIVVHQRYIGDDAAQFSRGPNVSQEVCNATIGDREVGGAGPEITKDVLGGRDFLIFDKNNIREFIYLNKTRLLEHYVYTEELNGKAERHHATYIKVADRSYLICWREMDTNMAYVGLFDYEACRMSGSCFYMVTPWEAACDLTGAMLIPVNGRIEYLDGLEPTN